MKKKILLVHPEFPTTYWGFQESLAIVNKQASLPPLGLITLASYLPLDWDMRLVDLNISPVEDRDLYWADVVLMGGMLVQMDSMRMVIDRARRIGRPIVVGGPAPTTSPELFSDVDLIVQGEVENREDELIDAISSLKAHGLAAEPGPAVPVCLGAPENHPDMKKAMAPRFDLLDIGKYTSMSIQYSRGCPFNCEFCDIVEIFGHASRVKTDDQVINELTILNRLGFQGSIFFVDDNFIGNKRAVRTLLPKIADWQEANGRPFDFYTEASINLADDPALIQNMINAGFRSIFVGIETPSTEALQEAGKKQNLAVNLQEAIDSLTKCGLEVMGGFIVGFDTDTPAIFEAQRTFIQSCAIPLAMIGILIALPETALWRRLEKEGRLREVTNGDQFGRPNFIPAMDERTLIEGYRNLLADLYDPKAYYARCENYIKKAAPLPTSGKEGVEDLKNLMRAVYKIGIRSKRRKLFWRLLGKAINSSPHTLKWAIIHAVQGEHMIRYTQDHVLPRLNMALSEMDRETQSTRFVTGQQPRPVQKAEKSRVPSFSFEPGIQLLQPAFSASDQEK
ncbi:MAG: DUF4070 domain-containing protein [Deltaproteobacteria bacterium]|nr:DUF4070 domain-containing protein [Deltaproteobacteria bacterium]